MARRWYEDPVSWLALAAVGGLAFAGRATVERVVVAPLKDITTRGRKLGDSALDASGVVVQDPEWLAQQASAELGLDIPQDAYSLARMIRSEGAAAGNVRGHVALNDLANLGWDSLHALLTYSTAPWARGRYGRQHSVDPATGASQTRRYSTAQDPYEGDVQVAFQVLNEHAQGLDPTGGAVKFLDKSSMGGVQAGTSSFDAVNARWTTDGLQAYTLPEYGDDLVLYRRA